MDGLESINNYQFEAATCDGFPLSSVSSQGASKSAAKKAPSFFGMSVDAVEPLSFDFLYFGDCHSDLFKSDLFKSDLFKSDLLQSAYPIDDDSVEAVLPGLCFDHVASAEVDPLLPRELALPNPASELSAQPTPPDQCNETVVANAARTATSIVSDVVANALMVRVEAEVLPVGRDKGRKGRRPGLDSKLYYGNVSRSRLKMITALESGISPQLLQRLKADSENYLPTEEEKINTIVKHLNNKKEHPLVAKYGVKELTGYIVKGFCYFVSGVERGCFQRIKRDAMKSYSIFKRRKMDDAYVELLRWANKLESASALESED